jgi:hypothetical protein
MYVDLNFFIGTPLHVSSPHCFNWFFCHMYLGEPPCNIDDILMSKLLKHSLISFDALSSLSLEFFENP